jgi:hypothetical protein
MADLCRASSCLRVGLQASDHDFELEIPPHRANEAWVARVQRPWPYTHVDDRPEKVFEINGGFVVLNNPSAYADANQRGRGPHPQRKTPPIPTHPRRVI